MRFRHTLLRELRDKNKFTRRELSLRTGISEHGIYKIEMAMTAVPSMVSVMSLAAALGVEPMDFFDQTSYSGNTTPAA